MRITKAPEERKREILETALKLFAIKGFDKTSISDIAKELNIAQGLCYRYFPSKEILFQTAIDEYSDSIIDKMKQNIDLENNSLESIIHLISKQTEFESGPYYDAFHKKNNKIFHTLLSIEICNKLTKIVEEIIEKSNKKGEIQIDDISAVASFCVYGQLGILNQKELSNEEKNIKIKNILLKIFY